MSDTAILHADADAFYAAVAQRDDPRLLGRPVIVGGGVVMAASYEARACGVRSGMGGERARRLCPDAVVVESDFAAYQQASADLLALFNRSAARVETLSMEEAFLDVRGEDPRAVAEALRRAARDQVGLAVTVGVASTKLVAKMASRAAKPDGLMVIERGREREFLDPLDVEELWGIGPATARRLRGRGVKTVGHAARLDERALVAMLGVAGGRRVHALVGLREWRPVQPNRERRSFGAQRSLRDRRRSPAELEEMVASLAERVARRMQRSGRAGRTITLRLRFRDYTRASRARTLARASCEADSIDAAARDLLREALPLIERSGLTCLGIAVGNLEGKGQLELEV